MKFLIVLLLCVGCYGAQQRKISPGLEAKLEQLRELMRTGNAEKGIPVLDPLRQEEFEFDMETPNFVLDLLAKNMFLAGISDFEVETIDMTVIPLVMKFNMTLPLTIMNADHYKLHGMVFKVLPIYGDGRLSFGVGNFNINGKAKIGVNIKGVYLKDMSLNLNLGHVKCDITGVIGGGSIDNVINAMVEDLAPDFFNTYSNILSDRISQTILTVTNEVLDGMSLQDLIDLITGK